MALVETAAVSRLFPLARKISWPASSFGRQRYDGKSTT